MSTSRKITFAPVLPLPAGGVQYDMLSKDSAVAGAATWKDTARLRNITFIDPAIPTTYGNLATAPDMFALAGQVTGITVSFYAHYTAGAPRWIFSHQPYVLTNAIWHAGNDGTGSGLDADLLDGFEAAAFARKSADETITGGWTFNAAIWLPGDSLINADGDFRASRGSAPTTGLYAFGAGGSYFYFNGIDYQLVSATTTASMYIDGGKVWTNLNDGAGSTLDADLLDGQHGAYYLNYANFTGTPPSGVPGGGTTAQFLRGDGAWSNTLIGWFEVRGGRTYLTGNSELFSAGFCFNPARRDAGQGYYIGASDSATPDLVMSNVGGGEQFRFYNNGRISGKAIDVGYNQGSTIAGITNQFIASGTWTPALADAGNLSAYSTGVCHYARIGNTVFFSGFVNVTPTTAGGSCYLSFSTPINTSFADYNAALGCGCDAGGLREPVALYATGGQANKIFMRFYAAVNTARAISFSGSYIISS